VATTGESAWMLANSFVTGDISISTPTVSVSGAPNDVPESPTISTSAFATIPAGEDTHLSTDVEVRKSSDNTLVWSSYNNTTDKLSIAVPADVLEVSTSYKFRARHNGNNFGSSAYADFYYGKVFIGTGFNGSAVVEFINYHQESPMPRTLYGSGGGNLTVTAVMLVGGTEFTEIAANTSYTIRIKIAGYVVAGSNTTVRLQRIM
jgi:hypothetical protein